VTYFGRNPQILSTEGKAMTIDVANDLYYAPSNVDLNADLFPTSKPCRDDAPRPTTTPTIRTHPAC
jgi:hypothetical protein